MITTRFSMGLLAAGLALALIGCTETAKDKLGSAGSDVKNAAGKTGDAMKDDATASGAAVSRGASNVGAAVSGVGDKIGEQTDETRTSIMVKTAIANTKDLKIDKFAVTVDKKAVTLTGMAAQADKDRAGVLAKQSLGEGFTVKNDIKVN